MFKCIKSSINLKKSKFKNVHNFFKKKKEPKNKDHNKISKLGTCKKKSEKNKPKNSEKPKEEQSEKKTRSVVLLGGGPCRNARERNTFQRACGEPYLWVTARSAGTPIQRF
jgi:hypothetical protein